LYQGRTSVLPLQQQIERGASQVAEKLKFAGVLYQGLALAMPKGPQNRSSALAAAGFLPISGVD
jgi:hypothetical protein